MTSHESLHLAEALRGRRYLISWWPWRAVAYLATTVPIAGLLSVGLLVFVAPLLAVVNAVRQDRPVELPIVVFLTIVAMSILAAAPIVSVAVAGVERWRLGIVDPRPLPGERWRGLAARYTSTAAWREVGYTFWLGGVVPIAYWTLLLLALLDLTLIASPWLVGDTDRMVLVWTTVDTPARRFPTRSGASCSCRCSATWSACSPPARPWWPEGCSADRPAERSCGRSPAPGLAWSTRTRPNAAGSSATCTTGHSPG